MNRLLFSVGFCLLVFNAKSQTFDDFKYLKDPYQNEPFLEFSIKNANIRNTKPVVDAPGHRYNGWLFEIGYRKSNFEKLKRTYNLTYKLIPEVFVPIDREIDGKGKGIYRDESSSITAGITGWHAWGWNLMATKKFCLAPGIHLNDYFFGTSARDTITGPLKTKEPQGWYLSAGPSLMSHYVINKTFILHSRIDYGISYVKGVDVSYAIKDPSDPLPHWFVFNAMLVSKWGAFLGFDYYGIINRGKYPNNTKRLDSKIGFMFVL